MELSTTRLLARHARERGPAAVDASPVWLKALCASFSVEEIKPHKVRYYLERRDAELEHQDHSDSCVSTARSRS